MTTTAGQGTKGRSYYGWVIVVASFLICLTLGEGMYAFGVFFKPLESEFGWSRATVSSAYTVFLVAFAISGFALGRLADRYSPRVAILLAGSLSGTGFILASLATNLWHLWAFLGLAGLGAGATYSVPVSTVQRWFVKRRGLVLGIVALGVGLGAVIFVLLANYLVDTRGWRSAYTIMGTIFVVVNVGAGWFLVHSPERKGLRPYGAEELEATGPGQKAQATFAGPELGKAIWSWPFVAVTAVLMSAQIPIQVVMAHLIPFATDVGISKTVAAFAMGSIGFFSLPTRFAGGLFADRVGWARSLGLVYLGQAIMAVFLLAVGSYWTLMVFVVLFALVHGARNPAQAGIVSHLFGTRSLGALSGLTLGIAMIVGSSGPYIAGFIFDHTQSYRIAFIMIAALLLVAGTGALFLRPARSAVPPVPQVERQPLPRTGP